MKTYDEILKETIESDFMHENVTNISPEARAAKEYAKQWVVVSIALAGIDRPITKNELTVKMIEAKIDAQ